MGAYYFLWHLCSNHLKSASNTQLFAEVGSLRKSFGVERATPRWTTMLRVCLSVFASVCLRLLAYLLPTSCSLMFLVLLWPEGITLGSFTWLAMTRHSPAVPWWRRSRSRSWRCRLSERFCLSFGRNETRPSLWRVGILDPDETPRLSSTFLSFFLLLIPSVRDCQRKPKACKQSFPTYT